MVPQGTFWTGMHENVDQRVKLESDIGGKYVQSDPAIKSPGLARALFFVHEPKLTDGDTQPQQQKIRPSFKLKNYVCPFDSIIKNTICHVTPNQVANGRRWKCGA